MKALKRNGLVRVTVTSPYRGYLVGNTVYLNPGEAQDWIASGCAEEAKLPKGVETVKVDDPPPVPEKILPNPEPAIPEDWEEKHTLQQVRIAKQITKEDRRFTEDEARAVIKAEIERRLTE